VFRWLPCITWHASDALGICGGAKIVRLGAPASDGGNTGAACGLTTMYRSPHDGRRTRLSTTQQTLMTQAVHDGSTERIDCCAAVGAGSSSTGQGGCRQSMGLQLFSVSPANAANKRQAAAPRNCEDSF